MRGYFLLIAVGWSICMVLFGVGVYNLYVSLFDTPGADAEMRSGFSGYTNPLLECEIGVKTLSARKEDFTPELQSYLAVLKKKFNLADVAVYFRDLNNGPIVGVGQNSLFSPASLLKVPIMMSYYSRSESNPALLTQSILFDSDTYLPDQKIPPEKQLVRGQSYTADELVERMIKYSDNQSMALLSNRLPISELVSLYALLGVDPTVMSDDTAQLSVRQYSIFFRILFNASYLSRSNSEKALKLLSESTFTEGLRAGVPAAVTVAHKFGERNFNDGVQQFHDCGIVYYPDHPYLLCVMMRGYAPDTLIHAIADTSRFVYEKIDSEYGQ